MLKNRRALRPQSLVVMVSPKRACSRFWKADMSAAVAMQRGVSQPSKSLPSATTSSPSRQPAVDVTGDVVEAGRTVLAEEVAAEVEANQAAALADAVELSVRKVAWNVADGTAV